ncbi:hypothetical protein EXIGLDRAFT_695894 [Exidia glandulosa HHB12029]|uniref:Uncharacterized protein n=1 Tax=Exidia glandulosa HHB12029 TaxID=1314781 RepID=A0A165QE38_EXIGL|nr:hypothetical protein EXIGLDRAFT_695894 [Exidia glandulosa HHB12029]
MVTKTKQQPRRVQPTNSHPGTVPSKRATSPPLESAKRTKVDDLERGASSRKAGTKTQGVQTITQKPSLREEDFVVVKKRNGSETDPQDNFEAEYDDAAETMDGSNDDHEVEMYVETIHPEGWVKDGLTYLSANVKLFLDLEAVEDDGEDEECDAEDDVRPDHAAKTSVEKIKTDRTNQDRSLIQPTNQARLPAPDFGPDDSKYDGVNTCLDSSLWAPALRTMYRELNPPPCVAEYVGRGTDCWLDPPMFTKWSKSEHQQTLLDVLKFKGNAHYANLSRASPSEFEFMDTHNSSRPLRVMSRKGTRVPALCSRATSYSLHNWRVKAETVAPDSTSTAKKRGLYSNAMPTGDGAVSAQLFADQTIPVIDARSKDIDLDLKKPFSSIARQTCMKEEVPAGSLGVVFYTVTDGGSPHNIDFNIQAFVLLATSSTPDADGDEMSMIICEMDLYSILYLPITQSIIDSALAHIHISDDPVLGHTVTCYNRRIEVEQHLTTACPAQIENVRMIAQVKDGPVLTSKSYGYGALTVRIYGYGYGTDDAEPYIRYGSHKVFLPDLLHDFENNIGDVIAIMQCCTAEGLELQIGGTKNVFPELRIKYSGRELLAAKVLKKTRSFWCDENDSQQLDCERRYHHFPVDSCGSVSVRTISIDGCPLRFAFTVPGSDSPQSVRSFQLIITPLRVVFGFTFPAAVLNDGPA